MRALIRNILKIVPALAMILAVSSVAAPCHFFTHQPDVPEELKKYEI